MKRIVVITSEDAARQAIETCFADSEILGASTLAVGLSFQPPPVCEYLFLDTALLNLSAQANHQSFKNALAPARRAYPSAHIVMMSPPELTRVTVKAVKAGADSYLIFPVIPEEVSLIRDGIQEATRAQAELDHLRDPFWADDHDLVRTESPVMRELFAKVRQVAPTRSTVLLTGETGTGKNVLSKLLHRRSNRGDRQFISVHCGAIAETLLESELFGHERGAFTGAVRRKLGKFEIADGGTLLLDEIGTISASTQIKLLEVLQERSFQRVGGEQTIEIDVRIIAATNTDLRQAVDAGAFRKDLFFRLNVFPLELPSLRERREDIPLLAGIFLDRLERLYQKGIDELHPLVLETFNSYEWPGNVRELESLMERAYILETTHVLTPESFPQEMFSSADAVGQLPLDTKEPLAVVRRRAIENVERLYLKEQLAANAGRINATARAAGITERQLHKLMVKHGLHKEDYRRRPLNRSRRYSTGSKGST